MKLRTHRVLIGINLFFPRLASDNGANFDAPKDYICIFMVSLGPSLWSKKEVSGQRKNWVEGMSGYRFLWKILLLGFIGFWLAMPGCSSRVPEEELGEVLHRLPELPEAQKPYLFPWGNSPEESGELPAAEATPSPNA